MTTPATQIRNLIMVIGAGMMAALMLAYFLVNQYGPTGQYIAGNIVLQPSLVSKVTFQDKDSRYSFDRIEWMHFDNAENRWTSSKIDDDTYGKIYQLIKNDKSIIKVTPETQNLFYTSTPSIVTIVVHNENRENTKVFQEIQFVEHGDFFRVLLKDDNPTQNWIYFFHPKVSEQINEQIHP